MHSLKNTLHKAYRNVATKFMGVMTHSVFLTEGKLTPDEFVFAGDCLVESCPTWSWEGGDADKWNKNLPEDKQFLITRDVPCTERAKDLVHSGSIDETEGEDGWVIAESKGNDQVADIDGGEEWKEIP